jgi:hypothetical protein
MKMTERHKRIELEITGVKYREKCQNINSGTRLPLLFKLVTHVSQTWNSLEKDLLKLDRKLAEIGIEL